MNPYLLQRISLEQGRLPQLFSCFTANFICSFLLIPGMVSFFTNNMLSYFQTFFGYLSFGTTTQKGADSPHSLPSRLNRVIPLSGMYWTEHVFPLNNAMRIQNRNFINPHNSTFLISNQILFSRSQCRSNTFHFWSGWNDPFLA